MNYQEVMEEWKGVFKKHGPIMSLVEDRRVMGLTSEIQDLNITLDHKDFNQVDGFV